MFLLTQNKIDSNVGFKSNNFSLGFIGTAMGTADIKGVKRFYSTSKYRYKSNKSDGFYGAPFIDRVKKI